MVLVLGRPGAAAPPPTSRTRWARRSISAVGVAYGMTAVQDPAMNADDFRDYMLSFLFLRYLSDNYEEAAQKELGSDYPTDGTQVEAEVEDE